MTRYLDSGLGAHRRRRYEPSGDADPELPTDGSESMESGDPELPTDGPESLESGDNPGDPNDSDVLDLI